MKISGLIILLFPAFVFSQQSLCPCNGKGFLSGGVIAGESKAKPGFQVSGGIAYDHSRFYTGIGVGMDPYRIHSIPVFADWRMNFGKRESGFVYGNVGYNVPYDADLYTSDDNSFLIKDRISGGLYTDAGIGYRVLMKGKDRLLISIGYSYKRINNVKIFRFPGCADCETETYRYEFNMDRIIAKLSWELRKLF